jgi:hypothetical protein
VPETKSLLKEFAEFKGIVTTKLDNMEISMAEIKESLKNISKLEDRVTRLEENRTTRDKLGSAWQQWVAIIISCGAIIYSVFTSMFNGMFRK